jgi:rhamnosyltransferase
MKVAVLMTTYNGANYLEAQIDSILNQKLNADVDLIVRDDGSTDETLRLLAEYSAAGKLKYSAGGNLGAAKGFFKLLWDNPGYDYYAFSDQDDVWFEDKLQRGIRAIEAKSGPALYCSNAALVYSDLTAIGRNVHRNDPTYNLISVLCLLSSAQGCTSVFNRELAAIVQKNEFPKELHMHDTFLTCLCASVDGTIVYDREPSMQYRMHGNNVYGMATAKQGLWRVLRSRLREITHRDKLSMYTQTRALLETYGDFISNDNQKVCRKVIAAEKSMIARISLVMNTKLKHGSRNYTLTKKLKILFGSN